MHAGAQIVQAIQAQALHAGLPHGAAPAKAWLRPVAMSGCKRDSPQPKQRCQPGTCIWVQWRHFLGMWVAVALNLAQACWHNDRQWPRAAFNQPLAALPGDDASCTCKILRKTSA